MAVINNNLKEACSTPLTIEDLPNETVAFVLQYLKKGFNVVQCSTVCKAWHAMIYSPELANVLWKVLFENDFHTPFTFTDKKETYLEAYKERMLVHSNMNNGVCRLRWFRPHGKYTINSLLIKDKKLVSHDYTGHVKIWNSAFDSCQSFLWYRSKLFQINERLFVQAENEDNDRNQEIFLFEANASGTYELNKIIEWGGRFGMHSAIITNGMLIAQSYQMIKIFDLKDWHCLHSCDGFTGLEGHIITVEDKAIIQNCQSHEFKILELNDRWCSTTFSVPHQWYANCSAIHYVNGKLFCGFHQDNDYRIYVYQGLETKEPLFSLEGHRESIHILKDYRGKLISCEWTTGCIKIWDLNAMGSVEANASMAPLSSFTCGSTVKDMTFLDEKILVVLFNGSLQIWNMDSDRDTPIFSVNPLITDISSAFSKLITADDRTFYSSRNDGEIAIWDMSISHYTLDELADAFEISDLYNPNSHAEFLKLYTSYVCVDKLHEFIQPQSDSILKLAMQRFSMLSQDEKNAIYGELYAIIKSELTKDYWRVAEHAFHGTDGMSATGTQKAQAIRNYLNNKT